MATPPLDLPCDGPVTYPGDTKILVKSSKGKSGPTLIMKLYENPSIGNQVVHADRLTDGRADKQT